MLKRMMEILENYLSSGIITAGLLNHHGYKYRNKSKIIMMCKLNNSRKLKYQLTRTHTQTCDSASTSVSCKLVIVFFFSLQHDALMPCHKVSALESSMKDAGVAVSNLMMYHMCHVLCQHCLILMYYCH